MTITELARTFAGGCLLAAAITVAPGCDRKEEVIEVETPDKEVEVERDKDTGEVDVDVTRE